MTAWFVERVLPGIVSALLTVGPLFVINHVLLRIHITKTTDRQTADLKADGKEGGTMAETTAPDVAAEGGGFNDVIARYAGWVNENVLGAAVTLLICILSVVVVYAFVPFQGYAKWNTGIGLFFNTLSSSFELITGVAAVVAVVALHRKHNDHRQEIKTLHATHAQEIGALHRKIDALMRHTGAPGNREGSVTP